MALRSSVRGAVVRLAVAAALLASAACGGDSSASDDSLTKVTYRGPFITNGADAPLYYAQQLGYFADEGLEVEIRDSKGSSQTLVDVAEGGSDFGVVSASSLMLGASNGQDVVSVATVLGRSSFGFFVPKESGATSIADLEGRTVAVTALMEPTMYAALKAVGLSKLDVKPIVADANALINTYLSGEVDAVYTVRHFASAVQKRPSTMLLQSAEGFNPPDYGLAVKKSTLHDDPETVRGFTRALLRGFVASKKDPKGAVDALLPEHPELDPQRALATLESTVEFFCSPAQKGQPYGKHAEQDWTATAEALKSFAGLRGATRGDQFFSNDLFKEGGLAGERC